MSATDIANGKSHAEHPPWCTVEACDYEPDVGTWHRGQAHLVTGYTDRPATMEVRAEWWNPIPERRRLPYNSPASIQPMVELSPPDDNALGFTPAEARQLAAALNSVADELDPPAAVDAGG